MHKREAANTQLVAVHQNVLFMYLLKLFKLTPMVAYNVHLKTFKMSGKVRC